MNLVCIVLSAVSAGALLTQVQSVQCTTGPYSDGPVWENSELWHLISICADGK